MTNALDKLEEKIIAEGGYDVILGFSQGGEVVQNIVDRLASINSQVETKVKMIALFGSRTYYKKYGAIKSTFAPGELSAFVAMGTADNEDIKDATRDTDNLWDLPEFKKTFEAAGIKTTTSTHNGGHEMPSMKTPGGFKQVLKDMFEAFPYEVPVKK